MDWIDVREKLPDRLDVYQVTIYNVFLDRAYVSTARFEPGSGEWVRRERQGVITAWKEQDEPYQRKLGRNDREGNTDLGDHRQDPQG